MSGSSAIPQDGAQTIWPTFDLFTYFALESFFQKKIDLPQKRLHNLKNESEMDTILRKGHPLRHGPDPRKDG